MSTQVCGCDPTYQWANGALGWLCAQHLNEAAVSRATSTVKMVGLGGAPTRATIIPTDPAERKKYPMATGLLFYFPDALAVVSNVSWQGNEQHTPGQPLHWARSKSADQDDTIVRHLAQSGTKDTDGIRHTAKAAWRILAKLQLELEAEMRGE